jgi:hypothetical protein
MFALESARETGSLWHLQGKMQISTGKNILIIEKYMIKKHVNVMNGC